MADGSTTLLYRFLGSDEGAGALDTADAAVVRFARMLWPPFSIGHCRGSRLKRSLPSRQTSLSRSFARTSRWGKGSD